MAGVELTKVGPERMRIYVAIEKERERQDRLHGSTNKTNGPAEWCTILAEEFGEAAQQACEMRFRPCRDVARKLRRELAEVAAVAVAWMERIEEEHLLAASEGLMRAVVLALENAMWDGIPALRHQRAVEAVRAAAERGITVPPSVEDALRVPFDDAAFDLAVLKLQGLVDLYDESVLARAATGRDEEIPPVEFPPGFEGLVEAAAAARGKMDRSTFQSVPPAGPPCTAEAVLAGAEALEAINDLGPHDGADPAPIFTGPVSDVALEGCIGLFRELVRRIDRSDSDSGWITKVGHWEWMASALEELKSIRAANEGAAKDLKEMTHYRDFYKRRLDMLQCVQSKMRDPERTLVCDILANAALLPDPSGRRYGNHIDRRPDPSVTAPPYERLTQGYDPKADQ